jgi:peptide deformylase
MHVVKAPDNRLRIQTKPVKKITPGLAQTFKEMVKLTKTFKDPEGVGLASTQVGLEEQFFVVKEDKKFITVINPKILFKSKATKTYIEGCLSIPNVWGETKRHTSIKVSYQDDSGKEVTRSLKGILAWFFQHEIDHLNGILFIDHVMEQKGKIYKVIGKDRDGSDIFEEIVI